MQTKLTLRLKQRLIRLAKACAGRLQAPAEALDPPVRAQSPAVQSMVGALPAARLDEGDYRAHLVEKHR